MQVNWALRRELWAAGIRSMYQTQCGGLSVVCPHGRFYCHRAFQRHEYSAEISRGLLPWPECVLQKRGSDLHIRVLAASYTFLPYPLRQQRGGFFWCWMPECLEPGQSSSACYCYATQSLHHVSPAQLRACLAHHNNESAPRVPVLLRAFQGTVALAWASQGLGTCHFCRTLPVPHLYI